MLQSFICRGIEVIKQFNDHKWVQAGWLVCVVCVMVYLFYKRNEQPKNRIFELLFMYSVLQLIAVYCPIIAAVLVGRFMDSELEYERLSWGLFSVILLSAVLTTIIANRIKDDRLLFVIVVLFLFLVMNNSGFYSFVIPSNEYKIDNEAYLLIKYIEDDNLGREERVFVAFQPNVPWGDIQSADKATDIYYGIRRCSSDIVLIRTMVSKEECELSTESYKMYVEGNYGEGWCAKYIIAEDDEAVDRNIRQCGYYQVYGTQSVNLYKSRIDY